MHQQVVGWIIFQTYYLRDTCGVRHCRYACITNQRINLVAFLQEDIEYLHEDYTGSGCTALVVKYADLSEAEIKRLVIEKKWFTSLALRLDCEMQRISQQLTSKVLALAERYAQTLPEIDADITDLEAKVAAHLKQMGY